jgi:hypothetical protein
MARGRVIGALAVNADDSTEVEAGEPFDPLSLPTLDERANFYLRAVYGDRRFTNEEYSGARDLMLRAMGNDIAERSNGRSPDDASLPLPEQREGLTAFADASLLLGGSKQPAEDFREAATVFAGELRAISRRLSVFSTGLLRHRLAPVCAAAAVAAVAGYSAGGLTDRFAPNAVSRDSALVVQISPRDPSSGPPSTRVVAEMERELASALNSAELGPDDVATILKRGQELAATGKFRLARLALERAAEAKSAPAALALARTYDPLTDRSAVRPDAPPDMAMARVWYEKAKDLGSTEAARRLTGLPASVPANRPSPK